MLQEGTTDRIHLISNIFYRALLRILYNNSVMANLRSHVVYDFVKFYFYYIVYSSNFITVKIHYTAFTFREINDTIISTQPHSYRFQSKGGNYLIGLP